MTLFLGVRAVAARVVTDFLEGDQLHLELCVVVCDGSAPFEAGRRITRTLDGLAATGAFRA